MKILAITNLYPNPLQPHRAAFNRHQFRMLHARHPMTVIAPIIWTDEWRLRRQGNRAPVSRQRMHEGLPVHHPRYWYTPKFLRGLYGRFYRESIRATFRRILEQHAPDVVFSPWAYPDGWAAVKLAHRHGLPAVIQVHGSDIHHLEMFPSRQGGTLEALQQADGIVAISRNLAARMVAMGIPADKIQVIVDGVDKQVFHPADKPSARARLGLADDVRHLLFVGNLLEVKGVDVLLEACARLAALRTDWRLHLVGEGPQRSRLEALAARRGLAGHVVFHGAKPHHELPAWFQACDLFVLPSRSEGIPNVLLEASACNLPWVATAVGGIAEIADMGASTLVPPEDADALATAIATSLDTPPPAPAQGPRDRQAAVDDLAAFLQSIHQHHATGLGLSPRQPV